MNRTLLTAAVSFATGAGGVTAALLWKPPARREASAVGVPAADAVRSAAPVPETTTYGAAGPSGGPFVEVELVGDGDRWQVGYRVPGMGTVRPEVSGGPVGTTAVRVPADADVRLTLSSRDFVYLLGLPRISKTQVAVPGREFPLEFRSQAPGVFTLRGSHLCGPVKPALDLTVFVDPKSEFDAWLNDLARHSDRATGSNR